MNQFLNFLFEVSQINFYQFFIDSFIFKLFFGIIILSIFLLILRRLFRGF